MHFRDQFPPLACCTYLNTASTGLLSNTLCQWRREHDQAFYQEGSAFRDDQAIFLQNIKDDLAAFFQAKTENTYLIPNFSFGFNTILSGLPKKSRFLLLEGDYPSVNHAVHNHGFESHAIPVDEQVEDSLLEAIERYAPNVLALSLVQYTSGIKLDVSLFKTLKERYPQLLIIADGTQFCGTDHFDFGGSGIDILAASGYKWLLAGYGNGFVFLNKKAADLLFASVSTSIKPSEAFLQHKNRLSFYFEPGHQDTLAYGSLQHSLSMFRALNFPKRVDELQVLSKRAKQAFTAMNLLDPMVAKRQLHSGIFNLRLDDRNLARLQQRKIIFSCRGEGIRVAFHMYNNNEDLDLLLDALTD